mgnify:CR=1 FL=1
MKKILTLIALAAALLAAAVACGKKDIGKDDETMTIVTKPTNPTKVCHLLICCRSMNKGTTFLVNNKWNAAHDYRDIDQVRSIMQQIKAAGITVVSVDFTNPPEWEGAGNGSIHIDGQTDAYNWAGYGKMLDNIVKVCEEEDMQFVIFIGNPAAWGMKYWNDVAGFIWDNYAQKKTYRKYSTSDNRPILPIFIPGESYVTAWNSTPDNEKDNIAKFHVGTCQVNDPIKPTATDGWGYRNKSASSNDAVRFVCPNSGVAPSTWARVGAEEWRSRVQWGLKAKDYVIFGSYDDTCDAIFWGIADVSHSQTDCHKNSSTVGKPSIYYDILQEEIAKAKQQ